MSKLKVPRSPVLTLLSFQKGQSAARILLTGAWRSIVSGK